MRAPFDRLVNLYYGPDTATPGVLRHGEVPARLVPDEAFTDTADPLSLSSAYLTMDAFEPLGPDTTPTVLQQWTYDYGVGDQVALTPGADITHQVVRVELRSWPTGSSYWRAHIAPLLDELPSVCSVDYWDHYHFNAPDYGNYVVERIGPTTWRSGRGRWKPKSARSIR